MPLHARVRLQLRVVTRGWIADTARVAFETNRALESVEPRRGVRLRQAPRDRIGAVTLVGDDGHDESVVLMPVVDEDGTAAIAIAYAIARDFEHARREHCGLSFSLPADSKPDGRIQAYAAEPEEHDGTLVERRGGAR